MGPPTLRRRVYVAKVSVQTWAGAILLLAPATVASAAPPKVAPVECPEPTIEEHVHETAKSLNGRGQERYDAGDYVGAIELWEQALALLPESRRAGLRVPLAHAHRRVYESDHDVAHLRTAHQLFTQQLEDLDSSDEGAGADLEAEIAKIDAEFAKLAAELDASNKKIAEAAAFESERLIAAEQAIHELEAEHALNIKKVHVIVGGSLLTAGLGTLAVTVGFLVSGENIQRQGEQAAGTPNDPPMPSPYADLLAQGQARNQAAIATGVIAGVLAIAGTTVWIVGTRRYQRETSMRAQLRPGIQGLELRF